MRITGFPKSTIHDLVKKLKERGRLTPPSRSGRPRILTAKKRCYLGLLIKNNNTITATEIATKLNEKYPNLNIPLQMTFSMLFVAHCEFLFFNPFILINVSNGPKIMHSYYNFFSDETTFQTFRNTQLVRYRRGDPRPCRGTPTKFMPGVHFQQDN